MVVLRRALFPALALLAAVAASAARAPAPAEIEYEVKAAFLYNFAKFVDWPPEAFPTPGTPVSLCVLGEDPFGGSLDSVVRGETLNGRHLAVRRVQGAGEARGCQVLFLPRAERGRAAEVLAALRGASVLTVGEESDFLDQGGVIRFVLEQGRVRFEINLDAAERDHLKLSSKLLRLARAVNPQRRGG